ncbi:MAG: BMP family ABC transporter substrate-binding protein [Ruminococcaceae bacterium]|nr:BMP family ABC transporter substrate-binding protein [Oscillospiraceae bacterium]
MDKKRSGHSWLLIAAGALLVLIIVFITVTGLDLSPKTRIGYIMTGSMDDTGWNGMNYNGAIAASKRLDTVLLVEENISEGTGQCAEAIHRLVDDGAEMIILSSYGYPAEVSDVISQYPDIAFYGISADNKSDNMNYYFGRIYQARYLAGIAAGMKTQNNVIGYVAAMPNSEVNRGINAFTLGVKSVAPEAQVNVIFTGSWDDAEKERAAAIRLIEEYGADVLTYHQNKHTVAQTADEAGIYSIGYNEAVTDLSDKYLTAAVWNWEELYYCIIREFIQGNANNNRHWYDMKTGVIGLSEFSPMVTEDISNAVEKAKNSINAGFNIFSGIIYDNNGTLRCGEDEMLSDEMLFNNMNWYVDGVVIYE